MGEHGGIAPIPPLCKRAVLAGQVIRLRRFAKRQRQRPLLAMRARPHTSFIRKNCAYRSSYPRKAKMSNISAASMFYCLLILSFPGIGHYRPWVRGADCSARSTKYEYDSIPAPKCKSVFAKYFLKRAKEGYFGTATAPLPAKNARESAPASDQRGLFGAAPAAGGEWLDPAQADRPAGGAYRDAEGG